MFSYNRSAYMAGLWREPTACHDLEELGAWFDGFSMACLLARCFPTPDHVNTPKK